MDTRQEIQQLLAEADKSKRWLQLQLKKKGIDTDIYYLLSEKSVNFDITIRDAIIQIFKEHNIGSGSERAKRLSTQMFHVDSIVMNGLGMLNKELEAALEDDFLSFHEKKRLSDMFDQFEIKVLEAIDKGRAIIEK